MEVAIAYVLPNLLLDTYVPSARRFVRSYTDYPPGSYPHDIHIIINGPDPTQPLKKLFEPIPVQFIQHNNWAKDIGAFMLAAQLIACDLLVCLGSHIHFHRGGWLDRMMDVYLENGPGLYGCWGYDAPAPHIRTTAFWLPPDLLYSYPHPMADDKRYSFEHGRKESILRWALDCGFPVGMVGWTRALFYPNFDHQPAEECLMLDQHTDRQGFK